MEMIRKYLKDKYQVGGYQIAQIEYLLKTMFSELSKMIVIGFLLHDRLTLYLFALCMMLYLRCSTGGLHFYTYLGCLASTFLYIWLAIALLPNILLPSCIQTFALLICMVVCYFVGPVTSKYRPQPSPQRSRHCICVTCSGIFLYALILYIIPASPFAAVGFWVIILHSLQLLVAKIRKKGGAKNDY